ncbi:hypothetical protein FA15DRAFT_296176 [Coprinopsis marcescibilis]|uniref:Uncharacterized protein n=1 Tax=Coprinopsis marcescibilis TaxID=230819 RepID=A0A5C3KDB7_COPMA|nr:hypothetical protein FA15DRAFT_296176 [Coprinopsis marcescibilis]
MLSIGRYRGTEPRNLTAGHWLTRCACKHTLWLVVIYSDTVNRRHGEVECPTRNIAAMLASFPLLHRRAGNRN